MSRQSNFDRHLKNVLSCGVGVTDQRNEEILTKRRRDVELFDGQVLQELVVLQQGHRKLEREVVVRLGLDGEVNEDGGRRQLEGAGPLFDVRNGERFGFVVQDEELEHGHEVGRCVLGD